MCMELTDIYIYMCICAIDFLQRLIINGIVDQSHSIKAEARSEWSNGWHDVRDLLSAGF